MINNRRTILIVDDIPQNIQLASQHLKVLGHKIIFATSGVKALSILNDQNRVDLILLDIMMPLMNGYDTCRQIRSQARWSDIPIIFLTARNEASDIVKGFEAGGSDYITKPFNGQELVERVRTQLELKSQKDQLEHNQLQLKELLHILSHDLRNSLSGISMTMDLSEIENRELDFYRGRLKDLSSNGLKILDLVRTMLLLEEKPLLLNSVNLNNCIEHTLQLLNPSLRKKEIQIKVVMEDNLIIEAEETSLINSVLMNVLTNAIKFSFKGGLIQITGYRKGARIHLDIKDEGTGIAPEQITQLFDIQKGTSLAGTDGEKGSGFGLPLVRKFMDAYGGIIQVRSDDKVSDQNRGTEISLHFAAVRISEKDA